MAGETVRIICPNLNCRSILAVSDSMRGKVVKCKMCARRVMIPAKRTPAPVLPAADTIEDEDAAS